MTPGQQTMLFAPVLFACSFFFFFFATGFHWGMLNGPFLSTNSKDFIDILQIRRMPEVF